MVNSKHNIDTLLSIMEALRAPDTGCPWDIDQSFSTIAPYTIEEAYEVADAIERGDFTDLEEELGDLLLQVVYHAQMAREDGHFTFDDVVHGIAEKMIRRHPHVFQREPGAPEPGVNKILNNWEHIKMAEGRQSRLDGVPKKLSGLLRAQRIQEKASQVGFDWDELAPVIDKLHEELDELLTAWQDQGPEEVEEELGDVLFSVVNVSRFLGVDAESALRRAVDKFNTRFRAVEEIFRREGRDLEQATLAEMDEVWDRIKAGYH